MKKIITILTIILLVVLIVGCENAINPTISDTPDFSVAKSDGEPISLAKKGDCITIKDGTILDINGNIITTGYDEWGYNYQAHIFNGYYGNAGRPAVPVTEGIKLVMKWSDTWLANTDCNKDGKLDRGYACDPIVASSSACQGSWVTNHQTGTDVLANGKEYKWTYFVKIITPPADAYKDGDFWFTFDGVEIGPVIWGAYAKVQMVSNDKGFDEHGILYNSPTSPGLGYYNP